MSAQRVTAADPFYAQPESLEQAVFLKGLQCILRAGGREPAFGAKQGREYPLIQFDGGHEGKGQYFKKGFHLLQLFFPGGVNISSWLPAPK